MSIEARYCAISVDIAYNDSTYMKFLERCQEEKFIGFPCILGQNGCL